MFDVAIVGAGPAAVSAALNLKIHDKNIIWFGSDELSDKVEKSEKIVNYPGVPMTDGKSLNEIMKKQVSEMGLEVVSRMISNISKMDGYFMLLADNELYEAKAVLLCNGATSAKGFAGEDEFLGRGVSYCATCDGMLYRGKNIAVFCSDKRYEHEVEFLAKLAGKVYLYTTYKDSDIDLKNVEKLLKSIKKITGNIKVEKVMLTNEDEIDVDGVFILRNSIAPGKLISNLTMDGPHIVVDRMMRTNIEGLFAAGDCTGRPYQIAKAVGEGNVAAHGILEYMKNRIIQ